MPDLDLLELAEDVAFGRRNLDNVIDQVAVAIPDDRARRRAVAELESLILGLTGVRAHARATASAAASSAPRPAVATDLVVEPRRVRARGGIFAGAGAVAAGLTALAGVVIVAIVVASLRPGPNVGGPSPSLPGGAVVGSPSASSAGSPEPPATPIPPIPTPGPSATTPSSTPEPIIPSANATLVFWTRADGTLTLWRWDPSTGQTLERWLSVDIWAAGNLPLLDLRLTVLVSPDGSRFAVQEHQFGDPASHDRTRVFDGNGRVLWIVPDGQPMTLDMAWSADGSAIALATTDGRWSVVRFAEDGGASVQALTLPKVSYRLLGFDATGSRLYAVAAADPAGNIEGPTAVDLESGQATALDVWPAGIVPATTASVGRISPAGGLVLARSGQDWVQRSTTGETRLAVNSGAQVGWVGPRTIVSLTPAPNADPSAPLGPAWLVETNEAGGIGQAGRVATLSLHRGDDVALASTLGSLALVAGRVGATYPGGDPGWRDFTLVDTDTGAVAQGASPDAAGTLGAGLWFGGWVGQLIEVPNPTTQPSPVASPEPTAVAAQGLPPIVSQPLAGPSTAWWSLVAPDRIAIWRWDPAGAGRMLELATPDTWAGDSIQRTVLLSPDGAYAAILEVDSRTSSPVQRLRVLGLSNDAFSWSAPRLPLITSLAWSPGSTALAVGSLPLPWTVVDLSTPTPQVRTFDLDDRDGYALLGFSEDGAKLYGYGTGGEAEFWQKPMVLDLATGAISHPRSFRGGTAALAHANATGPVDAVRSDGAVLALAGGAKGDLHWVVRRPDTDTEVPLAVGNDAQVAWGSGQAADATFVALSRVAVSADQGLAVRRLDETGAELPGSVALPDGAYKAVLVGVRGAYALAALIPIAVQGDREPVREAVLVDTARGGIAVGLPPARNTGAGFKFAGWTP
jgi:hypothetical protein